MTTTCNICCEDVKHVVECHKCASSACVKCTKRYLLESSADSNCMYCGHAWSKEFLYEVLPKAFVNTDLKQARQKVLFDREVAQMPATQPLVEDEIYWEKQKQKAKEINIKIKELNEELKHIAARGSGRCPNKSKTFVRKCPHEGCKGFLNQDWTCSICESVVCKHCNEIVVNGEHECNPDNVATMKLLEKDTKPCPSCGEMIFKIHGCDQMYCTMCHTAFSWLTSRIETGHVHNPHYFEWQRRQALTGPVAREAGDFECGGLPRFSNLGMFDNITSGNKLTLIYQRVSDIQNVHLIYMRTNVRNNESLRVTYMMNKISKEQFMKTLQQNEKKDQRDLEIYHIYRMLSDTLCEYLRQIDMVLSEPECDFVGPSGNTYSFRVLCNEYRKATSISRGMTDPTRWIRTSKWDPSDQRITSAISSMNELKTYANEHLQKIGKRMNMKVKTLNKLWVFV